MPPRPAIGRPGARLGRRSPQQSLSGLVGPSRGEPERTDTAAWRAVMRCCLGDERGLAGLRLDRGRGRHATAREQVDDAPRGADRRTALRRDARHQGIQVIGLHADARRHDGQMLRVDAAGEEDDDEDGGQPDADDAEDMFHGGAPRSESRLSSNARADAVALRALAPGHDTGYIHSMSTATQRTALHFARRGTAPRRAARGPAKGRGTVWAIEHRYSQRQRSESYDDGWGTLEQAAVEERLAPETTVIEERVKSILLRQRFARPHTSTSRSTPTAAASTAASIASPGRRTATSTSRRGSTSRPRSSPRSTPPSACARRSPARAYEPSSINIGSATDAYQPVERKLGITRSVIEVMAECAHPFSLVTKSSGIERDLDLVAPMAARGLVAVYVSVTSLDPALARILEPRAAAPHRRLKTIEALARAGVPVGVSVSPIIPFINEPEIERILEAAAAAGATLGLRHRPAPAVGGESDLPALARPALPGSCRARHGADPRDARRQATTTRASARACRARASGRSCCSSAWPRPRSASASTASASRST